MADRPIVILSVINYLNMFYVCGRGKHGARFLLITAHNIYVNLYIAPYTIKTFGLNLTQIGLNRNPDPSQYATDATGLN